MGAIAVAATLSVVLSAPAGTKKAKKPAAPKVKGLEMEEFEDIPMAREEEFEDEEEDAPKAQIKRQNAMRKGKKEEMEEDEDEEEEKGKKRPQAIGKGAHNPKRHRKGKKEEMEEDEDEEIFGKIKKHVKKGAAAVKKAAKKVAKKAAAAGKKEAKAQANKAVGKKEEMGEDEDEETIPKVGVSTVAAAKKVAKKIKAK